MIWLNEDVCINPDHISAAEWSEKGTMVIFLSGGQKIFLFGEQASDAWTTITKDIDE